MKEPIHLDFDVIVTRRQNNALEIVTLFNGVRIAQIATSVAASAEVPLQFSELQGRCRLTVTKM